MRTAYPALLAASCLMLALGPRIALGATPTAAEAFAGPRIVRLKLDDREYTLGRADAPVTMVEFTDYQCPYCREFQAETFDKLRKNYIDTGKLRFIVRDLPLQFHASARPASEAAHCAAEQGKFWEMHHALLTGSEPLANGGIDRRATAVGLDLGRLHTCMSAARYENAIAHNAATADGIGIHGTPAFVLGDISNHVLEGALVEGALPYEEFDGFMKAVLNH